MGTTPNDALRKPIRIDLLQPEPRFTAGPAYAMRETLDDAFVEIAFEVTNAGPRSVCFIQLQSFRLKDAAGADLTEPAMYPPFVTGSVFALDPSLWVDTCLLPGESGWVIDIENSSGGPDLYSSLAAIEFQYDADELSAALPQPRVIPDGYGVSGGLATVCFSNAGTGPAAMTAQTFSVFLALDEAGAPLTWNYLTGRIQQLDSIYGLILNGLGAYACPQSRTEYDGHDGRRHRLLFDGRRSINGKIERARPT